MYIIKYLLSASHVLWLGYELGMMIAGTTAGSFNMAMKRDIHTYTDQGSSNKLPSQYVEEEDQILTGDVSYGCPLL